MPPFTFTVDFTFICGRDGYTNADEQKTEAGMLTKRWTYQYRDRHKYNKGIPNFSLGIYGNFYATL